MKEFIYNLLITKGKWAISFPHYKIATMLTFLSKPFDIILYTTTLNIFFLLETIHCAARHGTMMSAFMVSSSNRNRAVYSYMEIIYLPSAVHVYKPKLVACAYTISFLFNEMLLYIY